MTLAIILTALVALIHFYFMYLEMVKWEAPLLTGNLSMVVYLLSCVIVAGVYALYCGIKSALYVQTLPALLALVVTWIAL